VLCAVCYGAEKHRWPAKADGLLSDMAPKSTTGRQYNRKRARRERQARPDEIKDQGITHEGDTE
jgi:hypothetical protein